MILCEQAFLPPCFLKMSCHPIWVSQLRMLIGPRPGHQSPGRAAGKARMKNPGCAGPSWHGREGVSNLSPALQNTFLLHFLGTQKFKTGPCSFWSITKAAGEVGPEFSVTWGHQPWIMSSVLESLPCCPKRSQGLPHFLHPRRWILSNYPYAEIIQRISLMLEKFIQSKKKKRWVDL